MPNILGNIRFRVQYSVKYTLFGTRPVSTAGTDPGDHSLPKGPLQDRGQQRLGKELKVGGKRPQKLP